MPMPPYQVFCSSHDCKNPAEYKIAARWSDGVTGELKTYALSCTACLPQWLRSSRKKQATCRLAAGETLEVPGVYHMKRGHRDQELQRMPELEQELGR